jgi:hypothetical protein
VIFPAPTPVSTITFGMSIRWSIPTNLQKSRSGDHSFHDTQPDWHHGVKVDSSTITP